MWSLVIFGVALGCSLVGTYVAEEKHRSPGEGLILGFLLGPIGVLVEAMLPTGAPPIRTSEDEPDERELIDPKTWNEQINPRAPKIKL